MRNHVASLFLMLSMASVSAQAQLDTTSLPMSVGTQWFYRYRETTNYPTGKDATYLLKKEILATTNDTLLVRVSRFNPNSILRTERWYIGNGIFQYSGAYYPIYRFTLINDSSWREFGGGIASYSYRLSRVSIFGHDLKCQTYSVGTSMSYYYTNEFYQTALGIGIFNEYHDLVGPEASHSTQTSSLIGAVIGGIQYGDSALTSVTDVNPLPTGFVLDQNYPNPFNPSTTISFTLPSRSPVSLKIYDVVGREVMTLASEELPAGHYERHWNASGMPSGMYFYRLLAGPYADTKKLLLIR